ncbi:MAG: Ig domain-containing protein [Bacteroidales bacterium]|nr:Ig domain-containing protein [Bacteroidales bacterium]MBO7487382.1 Ig domain-containing protein [Bacteroidales bacterium]
MKRLTILSFILLCVLAVTSCEEPVVEIKVSSLTLNSESLSMTEGESFKLNATVAPDNATDKTVIWSTSDAGIANVEDGMVTAVKPGTATITAASKDGGAKVTCPVTVAAKIIPVSSITLSQKEVSLDVGETVTLKATVKPENTTEAVVWTSNNPSVATVKDGVVTAVKTGAASITATAGDKNASCTITVKDTFIEVTSISLNETSFFLMEGDSYLLTATVKPSNATDKSVTWSSSDESLATVYGGKVTAIKAGQVTITAKAGDKTATCVFDISARIPVESITLNLSEMTLQVGDRENLLPEILPQNATDKSVKWTSSDENVATVLSGRVTAVAVGTAVITATAGEKSASCTVTVKPAPDYLTITNLTNYTGVVTIKASGVTVPTISLQYSTDGGRRWSSLDAIRTTQTITLPANGKLMLTGANQTFCSTTSTRGWWSISADVSHSLSGNLMSISGDETELLSKYEFFKLFCGDTKLKSAQYLHLTAEKLSEYCYANMFDGCTELETGPEIPAATLASGCFKSMFEGCKALTEAPKLPAKEVKSYCYNSMFKDCISLKTAPELPATKLANYSYEKMFYGCTALTEAPELPAKTLAMKCYDSMFYGCTALVDAPALPAVSLANAAGCYNMMFYNCKGLKEAPELPAKLLSQGCYMAMFSGCTGLESAPDLPATKMEKQCYSFMFANCIALKEAPMLPAKVLVAECYKNMFNYCTRLESITSLATDITASECTAGWTNGVALNGTFTKAPEMDRWDLGQNGIPVTWTVVDYVEETAD